MNEVIQGCEVGSVFDASTGSCSVVTCRDFVAGDAVISESDLDAVQGLLFNFVKRFVSDEDELARFSRAIYYFNTARWNGGFDALLDHFDSCFDNADLFQKPEFDDVIIRIYVFWRVRLYFDVCPALAKAELELTGQGITAI